MGYRNRNRGYQELHVWRDAVELFRLVAGFRDEVPYTVRRVLSQQIACADSVHRNIAEGWCRRGLGEYLYFLNVALGSLGEFVSGLVALRAAEILPVASLDEMDALAFKTENELLRLIEALRAKATTESDPDSMKVQEFKEVAWPMCDSSAASHHPITPLPQVLYT